MSRWGQLLGWPGCDSTQETSQVKRGRDYDGERQERDVTLGVVSFFFFLDERRDFSTRPFYFRVVISLAIRLFPMQSAGREKRF